MTGINKRSNDPKVDQKKVKINPLYGSFGVIKGVADTINKLGGPKKKGK